MRIISGKYKGRRINAPKNLPVRPTTDMAKEALFNILNNWYYFEDITVLDLYAGTGNISFEFASRGVPHVICVDQDQKCVQFISKITQELELNITAVKNDVLQYLKRGDATFDVIFADPPYQMSQDDFARIPEQVFAQKLLTDEGVLILEHSKHTDLSNLDNFTNQRRYGGSVFSFFQNNP
jgi:16S rRNA (guanine(966)-N(2))-methyltransferase RsmD